MKKKVIKILLLFIIGGLIFAGIQRLLMPKYVTSLKEGALIREYYEDKSEHDVIFIGDCEVYENFSPITLWNEYGINSFIRGSASQTIWQSYYLLEDTLRYETPKAVVFNVLSMQYEESVSEAYNRLNIDGMKFSGSKIKAAAASMVEEESLWSYIFPLFRYHDRWRELKEEDFRYLFETPQISYNGYLMQTGIKPVTTIPEGKPMADYTFSAKNYEYLDKITALCKENNIKLVLIKAPTIYPYWYEQWDEQMKKYAREHELDYFNLLESVEESGIDYQVDTYDGGQHLNVSGAEKLSTYFGEILVDKYQLENQNGDKSLKKYFERLTEKYNKEKAGKKQ